MRKWIKDLDGLLRGDSTKLDALREGSINVPVGGLTVITLLLGLTYGACMGFFALFREGGPVWEQFFATTVKVPLLFMLTLIVTFPSLYVFNALAGSRLTVISVLRLLIAALAVNLAVLASLGPIVAFFSVSTTSYSFMVLFNVIMFTVAGVLGLMFLLQTLHRLVVASSKEPAPEQPKASPEPGGETGKPPLIPSVSESAIDPLEGRVLGRHEKLVFRCWIAVFALVGSQMGWVLRPFLGNPNQEFTWFRERESSFFESIWNHLINLFGG
jgi:hypothetical protein